MRARQSGPRPSNSAQGLRGQPQRHGLPGIVEPWAADAALDAGGKLGEDFGEGFGLGELLVGEVGTVDVVPISFGIAPPGRELLSGH